MAVVAVGSMIVRLANWYDTSSMMGVEEQLLSRPHIRVFNLRPSIIPVMSC